MIISPFKIAESFALFINIISPVWKIQTNASADKTPQNSFFQILNVTKIAEEMIRKLVVESGR